MEIEDPVKPVTGGVHLPPTPPTPPCGPQYRRGPKLGLLSEGFERMMKQSNRAPTIHALLELDRRPDMSAVTAKMQDLITSYPLFRARISKPGPFERDMYWEIPTAIGDASSYIRNVPLVVPHDAALETAIPKALNAFVCSIISKDSFDANLGQWELYYVTYSREAVPQVHADDATSPASPPPSAPPLPPPVDLPTCHLVFRIHHAIGDGVLLSKIVTSLLDPCVAAVPAAAANGEGGPGMEPGEGFEEDNTEDVKYDERRRWRSEHPKAKEGSARNCCAATGSALSALGKVFSLPLSFSDPQTKLKAPSNFSNLGLSKLFASTTPWSVSSAKSAGLALGGTVNDIVTATMSAAMHKYLSATSCPVAASLLSSPTARVRSLAVVNTRGASTVGAMDRMLLDFKHGRAANEFSYVMPLLPVGPCSAAERVELCRKEMTRLKSSPEPIIIRGLNNGLRAALGGRVVAWFNTRFTLNKLTCVFSNLQGPASPLSLGGANIVSMSNFVNPMMFSMSFSIMSYAGKIYTNVAVDKDIIPDPALLLRFADESFEEICDAGDVAWEGEVGVQATAERTLFRNTSV